MDKNELNLMFENLLHIGNKTNYWNPKMKSYIYGSVNGIHVIDLTKTSRKLAEVKAELKALHMEGKKILFVATKLQSRDAFVSLAEETGHYYVSEKWVPGLLTNFKTIKKRIATYVKLLGDSKSGWFEWLTKKEIAWKMLELEKLDKAFKWLKDMKKIPEVIFVVDWAYEEQAVKEANSLKLKAYAILNTNGDDTVVDNLIPANTNSVKSTEFIANSIKAELSGLKVNSAVSTPNWNTNSKIKKIPEKKVSGENLPTIKKVEIKKTEVKTAEVKPATTEEK